MSIETQLRRVPTWAWIVVAAVAVIWFVRRSQRTKVVPTGDVASAVTASTVPTNMNTGIMPPTQATSPAAVATLVGGTIQNYLPKIGLLDNTADPNGPMYPRTSVLFA